MEKLTLSTYERYDETAKAYDNTRVPIGLAILVKCFKTSGLTLRRQHILDVGCGTGNYLRALSGTVGSLVGLDGSREMLLEAARKCGGSSNVELKEGSALELPFGDQLFDGAMINQVLHHLDTQSDFQQSRQCLTEVFRVLKRGAVLCVNTCRREQLGAEGPFWYFKVFPEAAAFIAQKFAPLDQLLEMLKGVGFIDLGWRTRTDECFFVREQYFDVEGPFRKEWRAGDSAFAVYQDQDETLETRMRELRKAIDDDSIKEVIRESERVRERLGQYVVVVARRP